MLPSGVPGLPCLDFWKNGLAFLEPTRQAMTGSASGAFGWEGSPTKVDKKGKSGYHLIQCFLLEDHDELLDWIPRFDPPGMRAGASNIRPHGQNVAKRWNGPLDVFLLFPLWYCSKRYCSDCFFPNVVLFFKFLLVPQAGGGNQGM